MTLLSIASVKASPGASTLAAGLLATWPRAPEQVVVLVEADPEGGSFAARAGLGYEPGLMSLASASRRGVDGEVVNGHAQRVAEGAAVLCGPAGSEQARAALEALDGRLDDVFASRAFVGIVDVGRLTSRSPCLALARSSLVLIAARPRLEEAQHVAHRVRALAALGLDLGLVSVGTRPYDPRELGEAVGARLIGSVPHDPSTAEAIGRGEWGVRSVRRTLLWRSYVALAERVAADLEARDVNVTAREVSR